MRLRGITKHLIRAFRIATAPLDWLEFAAFAFVTLAVAAIIIWASVGTTVRAIRQRDWTEVFLSLVPLCLLGFAVVKCVLTRRINWILIAFVIVASAIAFYLIYF